MLILLIKAIESGFAAPALLALLHHPACAFGYARQDFLKRARHLEVACFRGKPALSGITSLPELTQAAQKDSEGNPHAHPLLQVLTAEDWQELQIFTQKLAALFLPFAHQGLQAMEQHIILLEDCLAALATDIAPTDKVHQHLLNLTAALKVESHWAPQQRFADLAPLLQHHLQQETLRPPQRENARLAIYGLLEARLMQADLTIVAGLNEGSWPALVQSGPWLNRPMRNTFGLQQPERELGLTAHDFAQAWGHSQLVVTWSKRAAGQPLIASRWILRLRAVLEVLGLPKLNHLSTEHLSISRQFDQPGTFSPNPRPKARPPVEARPRRFSVTDVEKMLRDSYHIHARRILCLQPLEPLNKDIDASLRGNLIHHALHSWALDVFAGDDSDLDNLLAHGRKSFAPFMQLAEVQHFWWPRFERMARAMMAVEKNFRSTALAVTPEVKAKYLLKVRDVEHYLTARADRLDQLPDEQFRIIDYKSGKIPTDKQVAAGFAPQLTLEAALAGRGAFEGHPPGQVVEATYIGVSGGAKPVELRNIGDEHDVSELGEKHFILLKALLEKFLDPNTAYIPRHNIMSHTEVATFDHLSRRFEWELAMEKP